MVGGLDLTGSLLKNMARWFCTHRLLIDEPGEVGWWMGLPGGAECLQALPYLVLLLDPRDPGLLVRQV